MWTCIWNANSTKTLIFIYNSIWSREYQMSLSNGIKMYIRAYLIYNFYTNIYTYRLGMCSAVNSIFLHSYIQWAILVLHIAIAYNTNTETVVVHSLAHRFLNWNILFQNKISNAFYLNLLLWFFFCFLLSWFTSRGHYNQANLLFWQHISFHWEMMPSLIVLLTIVPHSKSNSYVYDIVGLGWLASHRI